LICVLIRCTEVLNEQHLMLPFLSNNRVTSTAIVYQLSKTKTPIHSIYWKNIKRVKGIYTMATISKGNPNTKGSNDSSARRKRRKTQEPQPSSKSDRVLFFLSQKIQILTFQLSLFYLRAGLGEMCIREGAIKHTIKRRNGYQHHDTCFRGEHRHIDDQEEQNSRRQDGKGELREREGEKRGTLKS
jgi:hypothetical protein